MSEQTIDRPIFIFGSGRSGTTVLFNLLARHPRLGWFSQYNHRFPQFPALSLASRARSWMKAPLSLTSESGRRSWQEFLPRPSAEANHLWARLLQASTHTRYPRLLASDAALTDRRAVQSYISSILAWHGRPRFVSKCTNHTMRTLFLHEIFPDARFVHIVRDGRAVANSLRKEPWWPGLRLWWCDGATPLDLIERGETHLTTAARHWSEQMSIILADREKLPPAQYLELRYEVFSADPDSSLRAILDFCELEPDPGVLAFPSRAPVSNRNYKWMSEWNELDRRRVEERIGPVMSALGYSVE